MEYCCQHSSGQVDTAKSSLQWSVFTAEDELLIAAGSHSIDQKPDCTIRRPAAVTSDIMRLIMSIFFFWPFTQSAPSKAAGSCFSILQPHWLNEAAVAGLFDATNPSDKSFNFVLVQTAQKREQQRLKRSWQQHLRWRGLTQQVESCFLFFFSSSKNAASWMRGSSIWVLWFIPTGRSVTHLLQVSMDQR